MTWDGILDENYWTKSPRILCLLKDTYDDFIYIAPTPNGYGPNGGFWPALNSWVTTIEQRWNGNTPTQDIINQIISEPLKSIGYVNIKKRQGGSSVGWKDLKTYAKNNQKYLLKQIELINPQIILCCGYNEREGSIFEIFSEIIMSEKKYKDKLLTNSVHHFGPWLVIDWWHPARPATINIPKNWDQLDFRLATSEVQDCIKNLKENSI
ncbi:MAG: hypothetical protein EOL97_09960 [Spirochaetia bacterium]|nr:hypothetical protein [Spirochaetia bacterium]